MALARASQITPTFHSQQLAVFRKALSLFQESLPEDALDGANMLKLRVRDWWIVVDEGVTCLDIFVDKGHIPATKKTPQPNGLIVDAQISVDALGQFHEFLLNTDALDGFADSLEIRIGTPGAQPFLRDASDFEPWLDCMLHLETWTRAQNRDTYVMLLARFTPDLVELQEGSKSFAIPLHDVKYAQALPFHSESFAKSKRKVPKKR